MRGWRASTITDIAQPSGGSRSPAGAVLRVARLALLASAFLAPWPVSATPAPIDIRTGEHPGYWRIALEWTVPAPADAHIEPGLVRIAPVTAPVDTALLQRRLAAIARAVDLEGDALVLTLQPGIAAERLTGIRRTVLAVDFRRGEVTTPPIAHAPPRRRPERIVATIESDRGAAPPVEPDTPTEVADEAAETTAPEPVAMAAADDERADLRPTSERSLPPLPPPTPATVPDHASEPPPTPPRPALTVVISRAAHLDPPTEAPAEDHAAVPPQAPEDTVWAPLPDEPPTVEQESRPAAATVVVRTDGDALSFTFAETVAAAAWRRGDHVWLVFAADDVTALFEGGMPRRLESVPHRDASVFRVRVASTTPARLDRDGTVWTLRSAEPDAPMPVPKTPPATTVLVEDPWLGATLEIGATATPGERLATPTRAGARVGLPTLQGFVVHDLAGAKLRPDASTREHLPAAPPLGGLLDLAGPTLDPTGARAQRRGLEQALFVDPSDTRRLALVRFLLGETAPFEALAVLAAGERTTDPGAAARLLALEGVASLLAGRMADAARLLPAAVTTEMPEAALWQAMLAAEIGDWQQSGLLFEQSGQVWRSYPMPLRREIAMRAAEGALQLGAPQVALAVLGHVDDAGASALTSGRLALLEARAMRAAGETAEAQRRLEALSRAPTEPDVQRRARLLSVAWQLQLQTLDGQAALERLEADAGQWMGDPDGHAFWAQLADLRAAAGDALGAFEALGLAVPQGAPRPTPAQLALVRAAADGEPPFETALEDAVRLADAHAPALPAGVERASLFTKLAVRVAEETRALHVADELYGRALQETIPAELDLELRLALARLRLERHLPAAALAALVTLEEEDDPAVPELRATARSMLLGAPNDAMSTPVEPAPRHAREVRATLDAVDRALEDARTLLDGGS